MPEVQLETLASRGRIIFRCFDDVGKLLASHVNEDLHHFAIASRTESERFRIWAVDLGLLVPGHGSLDYRIREAENIQLTIEAFLDDLSEYLRGLVRLGSSNSLIEYQGQASVEPQDVIIDDSDTSDDEDMDQAAYVSQLLQSVEDVINRLFKLSTKIRNPSSRLISAKAKSFRCVDEDSGCDLFEAFRHYDYSHILSVFVSHHQKASREGFEAEEATFGTFRDTKDELEDPWHSAENCLLCESRQDVMDARRDSDSLNGGSNTSTLNMNGVFEADFLVQRLAQANLQRRQQFYYWRAHRAKKEIHTNMALNPKIPENNMSNSRPAPAMEMGEGDAGTSALQLPDLLNAPTVTTATRVTPDVSRSFDTKSVASVSEYAPSNYDPGSEPYKFPPTPKVREDEKFFECPYCFTTCSSRTLSDKAWKSAHLSLIILKVADSK